MCDISKLPKCVLEYLLFFIPELKDQMSVRLVSNKFKRCVKNNKLYERLSVYIDTKDEYFNNKEKYLNFTLSYNIFANVFNDNDTELINFMTDFLKCKYDYCDIVDFAIRNKLNNAINYVVNNHTESLNNYNFNNLNVHVLFAYDDISEILRIYNLKYNDIIKSKKYLDYEFLSWVLCKCCANYYLSNALYNIPLILKMYDKMKNIFNVNYRYHLLYLILSEQDVNNMIRANVELFREMIYQKYITINDKTIDIIIKKRNETKNVGHYLEILMEHNSGNYNIILKCLRDNHVRNKTVRAFVRLYGGI